MTTTAEPVPLAGCVIFDDSLNVLLIHRKAFIGAQWEVPGGKVEPGEEPVDTAVRETREELGIGVRILGHLGATQFRHQNVEYDYEWFQGVIDSGTPAIMETDKHDDFAYHNLMSLRIGQIGLSLGAQKLSWALQNNEFNFSKRFV